MDMINDLAFPGAPELLACTRDAIPAMLVLRDHYDAHEVLQARVATVAG